MANTITGVLFGFSGSKSVDARINKKSDWVRCDSIFQVFKTIIEYDVSSDNHMFSVNADVVPNSYNERIVDIIDMIDKENRMKKRYTCTSKYDEVIEDFFLLMEQNGAATTRTWVTKNTIKDAVTFEKAIVLLNELKANTELLIFFVSTCLPSACRGWNEKISKIISTFIHATKDDVVNAVEKATSKLQSLQRNRRSKDMIGKCNVFSVKEASSILRFCSDDSTLNKNRINEIVEAVEPFVYRSTLSYTAIDKTIQIFSDRKYSNYMKVLLLITDNCSINYDDLQHISEKLKDLNITVVSCYIANSNSSNIEPKKLYSVKTNQDLYSDFHVVGKLFRLSSTVSSKLLPPSIFIQNGWEIESSTDNKTKLFLQIKSLNDIQDMCSLARNVVYCQDSLSDILGSVSIDNHISQSTYGFETQAIPNLRICNAPAYAAVLHLSMLRILGRDRGYPRFECLRDQLLDRFGLNDEFSLDVLQEITKHYLLRCKQVKKKHALKAVATKRPVVADFFLTTTEWKQFCNYFTLNPTHILTTSDIDISRRRADDKLHRHVVVLSSFNTKCLRFMIFWGNEWADKGFFRVENSNVLDFEFLDVFWTLDDLSDREKKYYKDHGGDVESKMINKYKGLSKDNYKCPLCKENSKVTNYSGSLKKAICPNCRREFRCNEAGNVVALYLYLKSLNE